MHQSSELLSRSQFRERVFARDKGLCIWCGTVAHAAHHIIERRLWEDGGYYMENGASLCEKDHFHAESTEISCDSLRQILRIDPVLPLVLHQNRTYDKWGNPILPDGNRLQGDLFGESSVQAILKPYRYLFLPYQEGLPFQNGCGQPTQEWVRVPASTFRLYPDAVCGPLGPLDQLTPEKTSLWSRIGPLMPAEFCFEGTWLHDRFQLTFIWEKQRCLSHAETVEWAALLDLSYGSVAQIPHLLRSPWAFERGSFRDYLCLETMT